MRLEPEDPQALAEAILTLYKDKAQAAEMGRQGRLYVETHYTRKSVAREYEAIFARLLPISKPDIPKPDRASL